MNKEFAIQLCNAVNAEMAKGKSYDEAWQLANSGTSEGARKGWEHRTRDGALSHLKTLRESGFKGRVSVEHDKDRGVYFLKKQEGELASRKPPTTITPYDKEIRRMKRYGTSDLHGALTDVIYDDQKARKEFEGDSPGASWEDAASDLAANYLHMHGVKSPSWE